MTEVSRELVLEIENCQLKRQQLEVMHDTITKERDAFIEKARAQVGADADAVYNYLTHLFEKKTVPLSAAPKREARRKPA